MLRIKSILKFTAVAVFWTAVWELLSLAVRLELLLPSPLAVAARLWELGGTAGFWNSVYISLLRISYGLAAGTIAGCFMAALTANIPFLSDLFFPLLTIIKTTPVASFIMLAFVWISKESMAGFIAFLMVLPLVWSNVEEGIHSVDPKMKEVADVFGFTFEKKLKLLTMPAVMPYFRTAFLTSIGLAWKAGIAAEVLCVARGSIGGNLYEAKIGIETTDLFTWTLVVIFISLILENIFRKLLARDNKRRI